MALWWYVNNPKQKIHTILTIILLLLMYITRWFTFFSWVCGVVLFVTPHHLRKGGCRRWMKGVQGNLQPRVR